jgi:hypothetical protein
VPARALPQGSLERRISILLQLCAVAALETPNTAKAARNMVFIDPFLR